MRALENQLEQKLSFWLLLGPILLFASLTPLFWNFPENALIFGAIVFLSVAVCWHWTWRGVLLSVSLLAAAFVYHYSGMDFGEMFWHLGMNAALTLGFVATALASDETADRLRSLFQAQPENA